MKTPFFVLFRFVWLWCCLFGIGMLRAWAAVPADTLAFDLTHVAHVPVLSLTYDASAFSSKRFIPASFTLFEADSTRTYSCQVRHRGATSLSYDKPNFALKVTDSIGQDQDVRLIGMRKDNYWILDAMASDFAKMRNRASMDLWLHFSRPPYHQAAEPKAINGYRGRYVEVYVNQEYYGLFCLMERVDRKQLHLRKFKKEHLELGADSVSLVTVPAYHRGLLYKAVNGSGTRTPYFLWQQNEPDVHKRNYDGMQGEYPDVTEGEPWAWAPLRDNIYFMAAKTSTTFNRNIASYFDLPVFIDYILFIDLLYANDNVGKNTLCWFYDQSSDDQRIGLTPWDLDTSWGRNYMGSRVDASSVLSNKTNVDTRLSRWYTGYADTLALRYGQLRDSLWSERLLCRHFDRYFWLFSVTQAYERDRTRWSASNCKTRPLADEQEYIHQWIHDRLTYLDAVYGYTPSPDDVPDDIYDPNTDPDCPYHPSPDDPDTPGDDTPDDPDNPDDDNPDNPDNPGDDNPDDPENPGDDNPDDAITTPHRDPAASRPRYDLMGRPLPAHSTYPQLLLFNQVVMDKKRARTN